jgi:ubiquinone/menaquinone biosynthesis C-methylase UbiE
METLKQTIGHYDDPKKTEHYLKAVKRNSEETFEGVDANVFNYLKDVLPKNLHSKKVLDIGCGDGRWAEYFSTLGAEVVGVDKSPAMVNQAKEKIKRKNLKTIDIIQGDMLNLPLKQNSIDVAFSSFSMMYFQNLEKVLLEAGKTVKPGGKIYIATNVFFPKNDEEIINRLKGKNIPINLGFENKISLENLIQPLAQYKQGLESADFFIEHCKFFEPEGVEIDDSCEYKDGLILKKVVFIATKNHKNENNG